MLTREEVVLGYRYILGREPESEEAIEQQIAHYPDRQSLRRAFTASGEFWAGLDGYDLFLRGLREGYWTDCLPIETRVSPDVMGRLVERIIGQWKTLGEEEPYWSVLTADAYKSASLDDETIAEFRGSGLLSASLIDRAVANGLPSKVGGTCLELGCGVGRITRHLASKFDKVIAVDISPGNLNICRQYMAGEGVENVETHLLQSLDDLNQLGPIDWFYSIMVLQHNSPPIQLQILENVLGQVNPGGGFVFQTPAEMRGYSFEVSSYLETDSPVMEVHPLPQSEIFSVLDRLGLRLSGVRMDPWTGVYGSYTYEGFKAES